MNRVNETEKDKQDELPTRVERHKAKSSLPKRSEVHKNKKKKSKAKIKFPMIKLLSLFFILLPFAFYSLYTYSQERANHKNNSEVVNLDKGETTVEEQVPTTATADDIKEKETAATKEAEELEKEKEEAEDKQQAKQDEEKEKKEKEAEKEAKKEAKAKQKAEEEEKLKAAEAKAKQEAEEKARKEEERKKAAAEKEEKKEAEEKDEYKFVYHTVQPQETLFRISMTYYKSQEGIELIRKWNGLSGNEISNGQVLKIPIKK